MTRLSRPTLVAALGLTVAVVVTAATNPPPQSPRAAQWKKVEDAVNKGLPKTAIQEIEPIIESALKDKAYPEAVKAIAKKITFEGEVQGFKPEEKITRMADAIAKAPAPMRPAMDAVLAHWYWQYFQQNRWRFLQRTATADPPGKDFTTWDLPRILAEIDKQFTKALSAEKELKATPIAAYDALVTKGNLPDSYRPTLWDFLAFDALQFYASPEQAGAKAADEWEIDAAGPAFAPADEFLAWKPETTDENSRKLKAVRLYQNVLTFHKDDADKSAFLDADLHRLRFAHAVAFGETRAARYKDALKRLADANAGHEISAMARHDWAQVVVNEGNPAAGRDIARQGAAAFPESPGGKLCHNLILDIEAKAVTVHAERVWNDPLPPIRVEYKNITKLHFRLYKADWVQRLTAGDRYRPEQITPADQQRLAAGRPDAEWAADLPATADYKPRSEDVAPPKGLPPGFYLLFSSANADFGMGNNVVSVTDVFVSDLAVVVRSHYGEGFLDGFVLHAKTGEPVRGAKVRTWKRVPRNPQRVEPGPDLATDANGLFRLGGDDSRTPWVFLAEHNGHQLAGQNDHQFYRNPPARPNPAQAVLFTDRALYRPGQTVQYKGIALLAEPDADNYQTLPNRPITVVFADPNGKEIARQQTKSNEWGSFSGSFTAPRDRLTGRMTVRTEGDTPGVAVVSVEEYKRPKFQVTLDPPKDAPKLDGEVKLVGKAVGYTGAAVNGAKVRYRVVREVRYPIWWYGFYSWRMPQAGTSQEIAHGTATTAADGSFAVAFTAKPDRSIAEKDEPTFTFTVHADVTDTTGETRSGDRTVSVGYTALQANLSADSWQTADKPVKITVTTQSLDGEGRAAKGTVRVYKLKQPGAVERPSLYGSRPSPRPRRRGAVVTTPGPVPEPTDPRSWPEGEVVATLPFETDAGGKRELSVPLPAGAYRAVVETADRFGKPVSARLNLTVLQPDAPKLAVKVPHLFAAPNGPREPGQEFTALWGTGYDSGRAFVEIEHRRKILQSYWTDPGKTQATVKQSITEAMRGGFQVRVTFVRENRAYLEALKVDVPWSNKDLTVKWDRFVSKLEPAKKETWTATVSGPKATKAVAEMVAALYDASLDAYLPHHWLQKFHVFRQDYSNVSPQFENTVKWFAHLHGSWPEDRKVVDFRYRAFPEELTAQVWYGVPGMRGRFGRGMDGGAFPPGAVPAPAAAAPMDLADRAMPKDGKLAEFGGVAGAKAKGLAVPGEAAPDPGPDLSKVTARKNLNETAFFFPHLVADASGSVKLVFTMPEALTEWKFLGFAHDKELKSGYLQAEVVTAKDLMVQPNPPRFLREGDVLEFTVKVSNQSPTRQSGKVRLAVADARTAEPVDAKVGNTDADRAFDIPPGESQSVSWRLTVPDGLGPVQYTAVGGTDRLSDGEEGVLPVLSRRVLVTESLPLPVRDAGTKTFDFSKLRDSGKSDTLKHQSLTVEMTSQPAWFAVLALPYLMEYPHECSEQVFNRVYANSLARHVANSDPKIRRVFDQWKNTPALDSPLTKNQDVKAVMLEETPWLRQANKEGEARRNVGVLFDGNRLDDEVGRGLKKLADMQHEDGGWPWFPGGPRNDYISLYIVTGFGRLRHLGATVDMAAALKAVPAVDAWVDRWYRAIRPEHREGNHLNPTIALYLYGRSFFLKDVPVAPAHKEAVDYWLGQARKYWLKVGNRQSMAHLAVGLKRFGDRETPAAIMKSIHEHSVSTEEMGMFWRDTELSWWWYRAPIETQAMMIEAFDEVAGDRKAVEDCKVWLLKQKQTQDWRTTKATADAVYALLLRGSNLLKSDALVQVTLGGEAIKPEKTEAGTGYYRERFGRGEVKPDFGQVTVTKTDPGVAWGAVHWQYLEDISKVTPHDGTPLKLEKALYKRTFTKRGPVIEPVAGPLAVGDEVVVRVALRTDRDMEYVHLKDHRGSGTEPTSVLSRYKFQDGLAYYEATKDTASHFFIDYLPKGVYVFEYAVRVQHRGTYPSGMAHIECMYAPEFNSHSASVRMEVK